MIIFSFSYIIFSLLGQYDNLDVEVHTVKGRVDMVMQTPTQSAVHLRIGR
ncbi:MAG: hypothetical protein PUD67_06485 [Prevotellaceae bacterium]|nr:hypothetical protein [Prevotellaceae bacterium]